MLRLEESLVESLGRERLEIASVDSFLYELVIEEVEGRWCVGG